MTKTEAVLVFSKPLFNIGATAYYPVHIHFKIHRIRVGIVHHNSLWHLPINCLERITVIVVRKTNPVPPADLPFLIEFVGKLFKVIDRLCGPLKGQIKYFIPIDAASAAFFQSLCRYYNGSK